MISTTIVYTLTSVITVGLIVSVDPLLEMKGWTDPVDDSFTQEMLKVSPELKSVIAGKV